MTVRTDSNFFSHGGRVNTVEAYNRCTEARADDLFVLTIVPGFTENITYPKMVPEALTKDSKLYVLGWGGQLVTDIDHF